MSARDVVIEKPAPAPARDPIDRPLFVIGTGRSGTTLFFQLLSFHPDLAWFSTYGNYFYRQTWPALLSRAVELPFAARILPPEWRYTPKPVEAYAILNELTGGVFTAYRRLETSDVTPQIREALRARVLAYLRLQHKPRFAHKHTGFARTRFLSAIFPTARFIHVYRDGRAVAGSLAKVDWWRGMDSWHWGAMKPEYAEEYRRSGNDRLLLAAISWKTLMDEIEDECQGLPADRLLRIRYDDLVNGVRTVFERVLQFAALPAPSRFWQRVERYPMLDTERKWRADFDTEQREMVEKSLSAHLQKYGWSL